MKGRKGDDCMDFLRNKEENEWYEKGEQRDKNGGD